jgi:hypothetical protein
LKQVTRKQLKNLDSTVQVPPAPKKPAAPFALYFSKKYHKLSAEERFDADRKTPLKISSTIMKELNVEWKAATEDTKKVININSGIPGYLCIKSCRVQRCTQEVAR